MKKKAQNDKSKESMRDLVNQKDWGLTALGPREEWPIELEVAVSIMLEAEEAISIYWGEDLILLYNDLAREQIGKKHPKAFGRPARDIFPEAWDTLGPIHKQVMAGKDPVRLEEKYLPLERDGELEDIWWNSSFNPIPLKNGSVGGVFNISVDITARKQAELKREQFLLTLSDAIISLSDSFEIQKEAARIVGEYLDIDSAHYSEVLADENTTIIYVDYHREDVTSLVGKHQLTDLGPYIHKNFIAGNTIVINDLSMIYELSNNERAMYQKTNIMACIGVPKVKEGRLRAYFMINQSKPREWSALEVQMIEEAAERTWAAVQRVRAEQADRNNEKKRLDVAIMNSPLIVWQMDTDLRYTWIKHPHQDFEIADVIGKRDDELLSPEAAKIVMTPKLQAIKTGETVRKKVTYNLSNGKEVSYDLTTAPLHNEHGEITGVTCAAFDITEHNKAERDLRESEERLRAFVSATSEVVYRMSPNWSEMYYLEGREFIEDTKEPKKTWLEEYIPIHERLRVKGAIIKAIRNKHIFELEHQVHQVDGTLGWTHSRAIPILNESGEITEWFGTATNITERKQREQSDQFLLKLNDLIRDLKNPEEIGALCVQNLADEFNFDRVYFVHFLPDKEEAVLGPEYHISSLDPLRGTYPFSAFPDAVHRIQNEMLIFNDVAKDTTLPKEENQALLKLGFGAWVGVPIRIGQNKTDWALFAVFNKAHTWTHTEISMLKETTERAWSAMKRALAEQNLRESQERLQMAQNTAHLGMWHLDIKTKTFTCSPICKAHFGRTAEDLLTYEGMINSIHPDDRESKKKAMEDSLNTGKEYEIEYRIILPDETQRWIYTRARPINTSTLTGVTLDISDRKKTEVALEQRTKALQTSRMKLRSLVNDLSHAEENQRYILAGELHDNLGQILGATKLKLYALIKNSSQHLPDSIYEIRDFIDEAVNCSRRLVNDLKPTSNEEQEDLSSALKWVAGKMEKHGLHIAIEINDDFEAITQTDLHTLLQVVQEMLFNVVKHADTDQAWLAVNRLDNFIQIKVEDKGKGFDPSQHKESAGKDGFGLFNVRQRIDLLGGAFSIKSEPGKGTSAVLQIPLNGTDAYDENQKTYKSTGQNSSFRSGITVLVVDDHQMMREGIVGIINAEKDMHVIDEASTGEKAIRLVRKTEPDVVIMDFNLPDMNGVEVTKKIKVEYPNTKVICISFLNDQELINEAFDAGASDFINKDETLNSICQAIRDTVS